METVKKRRRVVVDDSALAHAIGGRIKQARLASGLTQSALAGDRYTKAYISALEHGLAKPSMAALNYLSPRLGTTSASLIADSDPIWDRVAADLAMAAGDWLVALDRYASVTARTTDRVALADISVAVVECLCRLDRAGEAIRPATEAIETLRGAGRLTSLPQAEYWLASAQFQSENIKESRSIVTSLINRIRQGLRVDPDFHVRLLVSAGMIETSAGNSGLALAYLEEARGLSSDLDARRRATFLSSLATAYRKVGDLEGAIRYGRDAIALMRSVSADEAVQRLENELALAYLANGNQTRAAELAHEARRGAVARSDVHLAAHLADTEAMIALAGGDPEAAVELATEAIDLADQIDNEKARLGALVTRARAHAVLGNHPEAASDFEAAAGQAEGMPARRREILSAWADSLAALGQHDRAFALAREALDQR